MARLDEETEAREEEGALDARLAFFSASNFALISEWGTATKRRIKSVNFAFGSTGRSLLPCRDERMPAISPSV
jgi:hypothetical protein